MNKRKRSRSIAIEATHSLPPSSSSVPDGIINPFNRSPAERRQLSVAGLLDTEEDPTLEIKYFPHRGFETGIAEDDHGLRLEPLGSGEDWDAGTSSSPADKSVQRKSAFDQRGGHFDTLLRLTHQFLDNGDMVKATRAYDVLLQLRPGSRTMDVRQHSMWAIGAELLMRQCENEPSQDKNGEESSSTPTPTPEISRGRGLPSWGQPTNLDRVKAYFEALIQQHPYDHKFPRNVSALEFHLALLGCEIYNIHAEQQSALARLPVHAEPACRNPQPSPAGNPENAQTRVPGLEPRDFAGHAEGPDGESNVNPFEDSIRKQALAGMRDISDRMDSLMQELPYRKNNQFLRLRATAALYMADLLVPPSSQITGANHHEARRQQRQVAIDALKRLAENGGALDSIAQDILDGQEDEEEGLPSPPARCLSLTLPIRGP